MDSDKAKEKSVFSGINRAGLSKALKRNKPSIGKPTNAQSFQNPKPVNQPTAKNVTAPTKKYNCAI